jgi:hypothetical protein
MMGGREHVLAHQLLLLDLLMLFAYPFAKKISFDLTG